jgi:sortase A
VAQHRQKVVQSSIEQQWREGSDAPKVSVGGGLGGGGPRALVNADALIRIPRFGDDYVVPVLEGTSDAVLAAGFGHFADTVDPGQVGNYALAAHRVTHGEPLRDMPDLQPGDQVIVETRTTTYTYVLDTGGDDLVVPFTAGWVLDPLPHNPDGGVEPQQATGGRLITLTTCSELFHTDNRMIAFGHLVKKEPRPSS